MRPTRLCFPTLCQRAPAPFDPDAHRALREVDLRNEKGRALPRARLRVRLTIACTSRSPRSPGVASRSPHRITRPSVPCATRRALHDGSGALRPIARAFARAIRDAATGQPPRKKGLVHCAYVKSMRVGVRAPAFESSRAPFVTDPLPRKPGAHPPRLAPSIGPRDRGGEEPRSATRTGQGLRSVAAPRWAGVLPQTRMPSPIVSARRGGHPLGRADRYIRQAARPCWCGHCNT
jgi:hypothetical protein